MAIIDRIVAIVEADTSGFTAGMRKAAQESRKATKNIGAQMKELGSELQAIGTKVTLGITLPLVGAAIAITKFGGDFQKSMAKSTAIMGDLTDTLKNRLATTAIDVSKTVTFSASQAADAFFFLASAGLSAEQSIASLPQVAAFATAGQFDLARATDLATDAQSALGLTVKDPIKNLQNMTRVTDVLVKANTLANGTVEQFATSLTTKAGAALKIVNKDLEEGVAVLAAFADQGVKGTLAGSQLNIVLRDLKKASLENKNAFKDANVQVFDADEKMRNLADIIGDLEDRLGGMTDAGKQSELMLLGFQDRSVSSILTLVGMSDKIRGYEKGLRSAGGITQEVADKQLKNFNDQLTIMFNRLKAVGIVLFNSFGRVLKDFVLPAIDLVVTALEFMADKFDTLKPSVQNTIFAVLALVAAIGPLIIVLGSAIAFFGSMVIVVPLMKIALLALIPVIKALVIAMGVLFIKVIAIIAIFAAIVIAGKSLMDNWTAIKTVASAVWQAVKGIFTDVFGDIILVMGSFADAVKEKVIASWEFAKSVAVEIWTFIKKVILFQVNVIIQAWKFLFGGASKIWTSIKKTIFDALDDIVDKFKKNPLVRAFIKTFEQIKKIPEKAMKTIADGMEKAKGETVGLGDSVSDLLGKLKGLGGLAFKAPKPGAAPGVPGAAPGVGVTGADTDAQAKALAKLVEQSQKAANEMTEQWLGFSTNFKNIWVEVAELTSRTFQMMLDGLGQAVGEAIVLGKSFSESMKAVMQQVAIEVIKTLVKLGIQRVISAVLSKTIAKSVAVSQITSNAAVAGSAAASAVAGIPIIGPALAIPTGLSTMAGVNATFLPFATAFAKGGMTTGATNALIGEDGPEVVIPLSSGKVKNAMKNAGLADSNTRTDIKELQVVASFPNVKNANSREMKGVSQSLGLMTVKRIEEAKRRQGLRGKNI